MHKYLVRNLILQYILLHFLKKIIQKLNFNFVKNWKLVLRDNSHFVMFLQIIFKSTEIFLFLTLRTIKPIHFSTRNNFQSEKLKRLLWKGKTEKTHPHRFKTNVFIASNLLKKASVKRSIINNFFVHILKQNML